MAVATTRGLQATLAVTFALAFGCGGQSTSLRDDAESGGEAGSPAGGTSPGGAGTTGGASTTGGTPSLGGLTATGGTLPTGGMPPTGGMAGTGPGEECRLYARRLIRTSGGELDSECDFDRASLTLRCTAPDVIETTVTWNSLDDVLRDNRPIGHFTFAKRTWNFGGCIFAETVAYDAAGRPEFSLAEAVSTLPEQGCGHESVFYTAWDAEGRPRQALLRMEWSRPPPINLCDEQEQSYAYDDDANQITATRSGGIGEGCNAFAMTSTFDRDGLLVSESYQTNGSRPNERAYTTLETGAICRD